MGQNKIRSKQELGILLRNKRKEMGFKQKELAIKASVRQPLISDIENGETNVKFDTIIKVLAALDLDLTVIRRQKGPFDPTQY
ncbi:MAG: helix-turn-helix transcriptional regulator [Gammaproteobacteria bacterium]|jgi:HTH-type transcriptional regulator/antitoxin HipB|nr:helix-turn-helix transcriptional regulator [Gammaproteobacteria bacterium]MBT3490267.1 helix-turn-helix transcriptional regulator [Gammaproteobacteria bacterium]MBT3718923.1 helix-turn-helix transcriptional regulator [Gammaproteobacteria bacterium]MBT3843646.1 helix-turn-helix transcriptional regulator [Gammaproteobacteria bacterium]MBT3892617.1 helix-turn-helix transcriptional regulator [Gammaproteobacteria bacterium]